MKNSFHDAATFSYTQAEADESVGSNVTFKYVK